MRLDSYAAIGFADRRPDDLAPALAAWVISSDPAVRPRRLRQGVRPDWQATALLAGEDLVGSNGCSVKARWSTDRAEHLLRFVHRDDDPSVLWATTFRLTTSGAGTLLESAVARDEPRGAQLEPKAFVPKVVIDLLRLHEDAVRPRELTLPPLNLTTAQDVVDFMDLVLLEPARTVPVVLVARDVFGRGSAVDIQAIERRMRGIAVVATLDGRDAVSRFESLLEERGHGQDLRCYNGAVHTYGVTAQIALKHRLWLRPSIEALPEDIRSDYVGETLARHLSLDHAPPSFLFAVEDFDRRERQKATSGRIDASALKGDLTAAEALLAEGEEARREAEETRREAEEARREAEQRLQQAELEASTEKTLREALQAQLSERRGAALGDQMRESLRAVVCHQVSGAHPAPSPRQSLEVLQALLPDRLVVLQEALDSAEHEGARFRRPAEVLNLLIRLGTTYYDALQRGGDAQARSVFTKSEYSAQGSDGEVNSSTCERDRTRVYKGKALVMWPHLRAGGKGAAEDCLRIHFYWFADDKKIVVGHCGAHLSEA